MKKKKRGFHTDFCMSCCALLMPYTKVCSNCGTDNSWISLQDEPVDDTFLSQVSEEPFFELEGDAGEVDF